MIKILLINQKFINLSIKCLEDYMKIFITISLFLSLGLLSQPAKIMYYNAFGDYITEKPYQIEIDEKTSLQDILLSLKELRKNDNIQSNLVIIGYGENSEASNFFAASKNINYQIPIFSLLKSNMPILNKNKKWYIYFINSSLSYYVCAKEAHHWSSAFYWLSLIGLQNLINIGPTPLCS